MIQESLSTGLMRGSEFLAGRAFSIGQGTFDFRRDEAALFTRIRGAIPLRAEQQQGLFLKSTVVVRATVKGDLLGALLQGRGAAVSKDGCTCGEGPIVRVRGRRASQVSRPVARFAVGWKRSDRRACNWCAASAGVVIGFRGEMEIFCATWPASRENTLEPSRPVA